MDDAMCRSNANVQDNCNSVHRNLPILTSKCVHVSNVGITDSCAQVTWAMFCHLEIFLPTATLSFHSYSFHHTAESFICESPSISLLTTKIVLHSTAPLWCSFLVGWPWFSHYRSNRTCPSIICTLSEPARLCTILLNIHSICPYLLKSHNISSFVIPAQNVNGVTLFVICWCAYF
jgi:hypothetical protein